MNNNKQDRFFAEATLNLQHEGFATGQPEDGLLPVVLNGQRLCLATKSGGVRYRTEDASGDSRRAALDRVTAIVRTTAEYMRQLEAAPFLKADSLSGDYRLMAEFNGIVLAGHPTQYGAQFITWEWTNSHTSLWQGFYYEGAKGYDAAMQDFAVRSGLIPRSALFTQEQLTEVYRSIHETLDSEYPITEERQTCLRSAAEQIERVVPDLEERVALSNQKELEASEQSGMQFC